MNLFAYLNDPVQNLLSCDGEVHYYGAVMLPVEADNYFDALMQDIDWRHDEAVMFGKHITTKRKVAWYGDAPFSYTYSKVTKQALPWTDDLLALKALVEQETSETYNSCLLNLYHDGSEGMAWHSDAERDLKRHGAIASVSLGAERKFAFKHKKSHEVVSLVLEHGSILVMKGTCQDHWLHRLPTTKKVSESRVNLTFRTIDSQS